MMKKQKRDQPAHDQPSTSSSHQSIAAMNGSKSIIRRSGPIKPELFENLNLLSVVNGAGGKTETVKDVVTLANFRKLRPECQQYLLRMLPEKDCKRRLDGSLEPTFSAFKNEYLSAALLDFDERLNAGELLWTGEIAPLPPVPKSCPELRGPPPGLKKLRINTGSAIITIVPQDQKQNGCSTAISISRKIVSNGKKQKFDGCGLSVDGAKSVVSETVLDLTPYFANRAMEVGAIRPAVILARPTDISKKFISHPNLGPVTETSTSASKKKKAKASAPPASKKPSTRASARLASKRST